MNPYRTDSFNVHDITITVYYDIRFISMALAYYHSPKRTLIPRGQIVCTYIYNVYVCLYTHKNVIDRHKKKTSNTKIQWQRVVKNALTMCDRA